MTGEQLFFHYLENGPDEYSSVLMTLYSDLGEELFSLLSKANNENKKLDIKSYYFNNILRDLTIDDIVYI